MADSKKHNGFITLHRSITEWYGIGCPYRLSLWIHLLIKANHKTRKFLFNGKPTVVERGQFITGRKVLSKESGVSESKVQRLLEEFEKESQIEQQKTNTSRLITIINYNQYQSIEQQVNNKRTTDEQQVNTNNNVTMKQCKKKEGKNSRFTQPTLLEIQQYVREASLNIKPAKFLDYYNSNGWMVGKNKMKDWKAAVRNWNRRDKESKPDPQAIKNRSDHETKKTDEYFKEMGFPV